MSIWGISDEESTQIMKVRRNSIKCLHDFWWWIWWLLTIQNSYFLIVVVALEYLLCVFNCSSSIHIDIEPFGFIWKVSRFLANCSWLITEMDCHALTHFFNRCSETYLSYHLAFNSNVMCNIFFIVSFDFDDWKKDRSESLQNSFM